MCLSHLKQIGNAILFYNMEFGSRLPTSLALIAGNEGLDGRAMICGSTGDTPAAGSTTRAFIDELEKPGHCSYVFVAGGLNLAELPADAVLAYEPAARHNMTQVLFADGHAERLPVSAEIVILQQVANGVSPVRYPTTQPSTQGGQ